MCQCKNFQTSEVLKRWIQEGYKMCFAFVEGRLVQQSDGNVSYTISTVSPNPKPSVDDEIMVYVFRTPDGFFGHAMLPLYEEEVT